MTAVQSLSFAQRKSEQNKIAIAKAGYHRGDGILPFVLRDQVRFVRTWSSPYMTHWGQSLRTHVRRKMAKFHYIGLFFHGGVWYTRLSSTNRNLYIKENIGETFFMFALFKCRKSDKGRN